MLGIHKKLGKQFRTEKRSLNDRGVPSDSFFHVYFSDGSERSEHDLNWSDLAEFVLVDFFGRKKVVCLSSYQIKKLVISHNGLTTEIEVKDGEKVYQAIVGHATYRSDGETENKVTGRIIGKVKNGIVLEERLIDGQTGEITGLKL